MWPDIDRLTKWTNTQRWANILFTYAYHSPPALDILESGSGFGKSTVCLAMGKMTHPGKVVTFDPHTSNPPFPGQFDKGQICKKFQSNLETFHVAHKVTHHCREFTDEILPGDVRYGMFFVDGDHSQAGVLQDLKMGVPRLAPGAYILLDDFHLGEVRAAVKLFCNEQPLHEIMPVVDGDNAVGIYML